VFSRISRYRKLPDVVLPDVRGGAVASKALRLLPDDVPGTFRHTVAEGERLDHLAFRYYRQPRKWWRICDANPAFLSPLDLLGTGPFRTARFPLSVAAGSPPWAAASSGLAAHAGVEQFRFADEVRLMAVPQVVAGQQVTVNVETHELHAVVTYNELLVGSQDLRAVLMAAGFVVGGPLVVGQTGKGITVPPDVV
jgi:hypothetical protein